METSRQTGSVVAGRPAAPLHAALSESVERNRVAPSGTLERKIIELRHEAFEELRDGPAGELPTIDDVQPPSGVVTRDDLVLADVTPHGLRAHLLRYGAALLPGLLGPARVDALTSAIDRAFEAYDTAHDDGADSHDERWFTPFDPPGGVRMRQDRKFNRDGGGMWATDSPRAHFELVETLRKTGLTSLIDDYLGEPAALSVNKSTLRRVPPGARTGDWHQDGAFLGDGIRSINAWISLTRCGVDAPGLDLVPKRMGLARTGTEGAFFDWAVAPAEVDEVRGDVEVIRPEFDPGDVLLFDHFFLHRTASTPSMTNARYAIEAWFFAASSYPDGQLPIVP